MKTREGDESRIWLLNNVKTPEEVFLYFLKTLRDSVSRVDGQTDVTSIDL